MGQWLRSPPGQYLLAWEQVELDRAVADVFGFHAVQLGLAELDGLRTNRMPHRWVASDTVYVPEPVPVPEVDDSLSTLAPLGGLHLHCEFDALPFPAQCMDLVVLPHALELARDAHQTLREVERVLVPEGHVVITGFNPASLWGLRQRVGRLFHGRDSTRALIMPRAGELIGYWRLRDWLRLLGFEVVLGRFGCWRPPWRSARWLQRGQWIERAGSQWWPVLGAVYILVAVKRVRGMRLVGSLRRQRSASQAAKPVVVSRGPWHSRDNRAP